MRLKSASAALWSAFRTRLSTSRVHGASTSPFRFFWILRKPLKSLAHPTRFELVTSAFGGQDFQISNQLATKLPALLFSYRDFLSNPVEIEPVNSVTDWGRLGFRTPCGHGAAGDTTADKEKPRQLVDLAG
jgi:hypothetical protein